MNPRRDVHITTKTMEEVLAACETREGIERAFLTPGVLDEAIALAQHRSIGMKVLCKFSIVQQFRVPLMKAEGVVGAALKWGDLGLVLLNNLAIEQENKVALFQTHGVVAAAMHMPKIGRGILTCLSVARANAEVMFDIPGLVDVADVRTLANLSYIHFERMYTPSIVARAVHDPIDIMASLIVLVQIACTDAQCDAIFYKALPLIERAISDDEKDHVVRVMGMHLLYTLACTDLNRKRILSMLSIVAQVCAAEKDPKTQEVGCLLMRRLTLDAWFKSVRLL